MPSSQGGQRPNYKKQQKIREEGEALQILEKRRRTLNQGGRVRNMSMWGAAGAEDSIISHGGEEDGNINASGLNSDNDSQSPTKYTEVRDDSKEASQIKDTKMVKMGGKGCETDRQTEKQTEKQTDRTTGRNGVDSNSIRSYRGSLTQRGARQNVFKLAQDREVPLESGEKPIMITRLTNRNKARNALGPASSNGFPSVRSKMLKNEDVRGDLFLDTSKFNYSHYRACENTKREQALAPTTISLKGYANKPNSDSGEAGQRSHSIDAQQTRRPIEGNHFKPGSFAEKEAYLLLNKINEINQITSAPKQLCQKLDLKRFNAEMSESISQPRESTATKDDIAAKSKSKIPLVVQSRTTRTTSIASAEVDVKSIASETDTK